MKCDMHYCIFLFSHLYVHVKFCYNVHIEKNYNTSSKLSLIALYSFMHIFFYIYYAPHELETNEKQKNNKIRAIHAKHLNTEIFF